MANEIPKTPKHKYHLNTIALLAILVLAYFSFAFVTGSLPEPVRLAIGIQTKAEAATQQFNSTFSDKLVSYTEPTYGFTIAYPLGYRVEEGDGQLVYFRASVPIPGFSSEVVEVYLSNQSFTESEFKATLATENQSEIQFAGSKRHLGKQYWQINDKKESPFTDEILFTRNAFYNCNAPDGRAYSAAIVFVVPEAVASDIELADYVIASFKC